MKAVRIARRIAVWAPSGGHLVVLCLAVVSLVTERADVWWAAVALWAYEVVRERVLERLDPCRCACLCDAALFDDGDGEVLV